MKREISKKLSFIVPVYNVEKYLRECIDSILNQMTEECELILVDDGSTDLSGEICDEYEEKSEWVRVVHKENEGPAVARNIGLTLSKGKYVAYVDSDDRIASECMQVILNWTEMSEADVCFMQAVKFYKNGKVEEMADGIEQKYVINEESSKVLEYLSSRSKFSGSACTKLYRREFLQENNIRFPENWKCVEDLAFVRDCLLRGRNFDVMEIPYYEYRQEVGDSRSNSASKKLFLGLNLFLSTSVEVLTKYKKPISVEAKYAMSWTAYEYVIMLWHYSRLESSDKKKYYHLLKNNLWVMKYSGTPKIKCIYFLIKILGIRLVAFCLKKYMVYR